MDSQTKVMTVSYGTFSCTLEGFDDPFITMQLVAEYFRKLAANDRYFGGDPLQPDADTLHQIARDANPNKVDAEVSDNSIILRQADVVDAPAPAPAPAPAVKAPEPKAYPEFASRRMARVKSVKSHPIATTDETLVEPTMFASRRNALEPAEQEPQIPAAQVLAEEAPIPKETDMEKAVEKVASAMAEELAVETAPAPIVKRAARFQNLSKDNDIQHEEEALERLLETTNSKLSTPSHARRSNALERLKAAVAATEAERRLRGGSKTSRPKVQDLSVDPDAFRKEMYSVRKTHEDDTKISRPILNRKASTRRRSNIATLILGSDQRVAASEPMDTNQKKKRALMG